LAGPFGHCACNIDSDAGNLMIFPSLIELLTQVPVLMKPNSIKTGTYVSYANKNDNQPKIPSPVSVIWE
jgi:hypothetical protein